MNPVEIPPNLTLYQHKKRPQWGLALLSWEGDDRRSFLFEDGEVRTIKEDFYSMMGELREVPNGREDIVLGLIQKLETVMPSPRRNGSSSEPPKPTMTFDEQVKAFKADFPEGFTDPEWIEKVRGEVGGRKLKKLRSPALVRAAEHLTKESFGGFVAAGDAASIRTALVAVLKGTDFVRPADVKPIAALDDDATMTLGRAVNEVLYGEGAYELRFAGLVSAFPGDVNWGLATAIPALVHPGEHVCIRPTPFRQQARWFDPRLAHNAKPTATIYQRYLQLAKTVQSALIKAGLKPRDLIDTFDFIRLTLRAGAKKKKA